MKNYHDSIHYHNRVLAKNPNNIQSLHGKGAYFANYLGFYAMAIKYYKRVLSIDPNYFKSIKSMGIALMELNYNEEALLWFNKALSIDKNDAETWNNKGCVLADMYRFNEAILCFKQAVKINPKKINGINNIISMHMQKKEYEKAIFLLDKLISLQENSSYWTRKGHCYILLENYSYAQECIDKALALNFEDERAAQMKAWLEAI